MAKAPKDKTIPNLDNATAGYLVDEIATMRVEAARLKFLDGIYKEALQARITTDQLSGDKFIEGEKYVGEFTDKTQERVDADAVRTMFKNDPETLRKLIKLVTFKQLDINPKP